ncbi:MAG: glycosyltransferase family 4 protein [Phycisphaeraceae bacterium]
MTADHANPRRRLALVIEHLDPLAGGAERNVVELADHFTRRGDAVTILTAGCPADLTLPGIAIDSAELGRPKNSGRLLRFTRWAAARLASGDFDASLSATMSVPATIVQPLAGTMRETLQRNIALRDHLPARLLKQTTAALRPKYRTLLALERRTATSPAVFRFAAISRYVAEQLQRHYDVPAERIEVTPAAVEVPDVDDATRAADRQLIRSSFDIADDPVVYLFAAFNARLKGIVPLMHAMQRLKQRDLPALLLVAGPLSHHWHDLAVRLGVRDRVRFVGTTQEMDRLYHAVDVAAVPSYYDSAGRIIVEALLRGIPAISTRYAGASDMIRRADGRLAGRVLDDPADVDALAQAMAELADPAERVRCAAAAEGLAAEVSMQRHMDQLDAMLVAAVAQKKKPTD